MKKLFFSFLFLITFSITAQELPELKKNVSIKQKDVNASEFKNQNSNKVLDKKAITLKSNSTVRPLYIVDGKITEGNKLNSIDPKSISSVTVFKGKEAVKKYGKRGKNGVVVINLK